MASSEVVRFAQLQSVLDVSFLAELTDLKLNVLKLSEEPVEVVGYFSPNRYESVPARLTLDVSSLRPAACSRLDCHAAPGRLLLYNTIEGFRGADKPALMRQVAAEIWADICSGAAEAEPWRLCRFLLLLHGDLKHYKFNYWFAFPALKPPSPFTTPEAPPARLGDALPPAAVEAVTEACRLWRYPPATEAAAAAAAAATAAAEAGPAAPAGQGEDQEDVAAAPSSSTAAPNPVIAATPAEVLARTPAPFWLLASPHADFSADVTAHPLSDWAALAAEAEAGAGAGAGAEEPPAEEQPPAQPQGPGGSQRRRHVLVAMSDASNLPDCPAWQLRNVLLLAAVRWRVPELRVLCLRENSRGGGRLDARRSLLLRAALPAFPSSTTTTAASSSSSTPPPHPCPPDAVGWEPDAAGALRPRFLDLGPHLRPEAQAEQAVDLNLRLMRWRAAPQLDVGALAATKCLLLGAGTLGCAVARTLQAWGVRHITLVDSGRVAFSNPVRQSLFNFEDCLAGGRPKAQAAAEALQRIFPSAVTRAVELSIPMPGHPPAGAAQEAAMREAAAQLDALVAAHDALFLLTDTRESRWLPALLAAAHGKLAITAAVGFDSFLVMRHGAPPGEANAPAAGATAATAGGAAAGSSTAAAAGGGGGGRRLGCYFCNDVVAPANSTRDRSLDQQCTVARPGLAPVAGALATELLAAVVQQREGVCAPPPSVQQREGTAPPLGSAPHMIRGQLASFSQVVMEGWAFGQCTACSAAVVDAYRRRGWGLVAEALASPASLEALTGLAELHAAAAAAMMDDVEEEEDEEEEEEGKGKGRREEKGEGAKEEEVKVVKEAKGEEGGQEDEEDDDWTAL
ncbi:hypothetical protein HYH02_000996 [Chlamydomonas schloesseri]|uniref:Ubiquitin-like modifier-activating enzyme ATG7 n=1 Tax=Chlamydomonas schloesseri TaxID=2026947 RepID=A0A836BE22_9CHLO|nr:hypothetical protein HYH02_000996 [Chlamydomonas schloesseri]|eukprot:KAG2455180.1 hypothetical protein HYH02_000996 [Chlamydomonas schloesseri]